MSVPSRKRPFNQLTTTDTINHPPEEEYKLDHLVPERGGGGLAAPPVLPPELGEQQQEETRVDYALSTATEAEAPITASAASSLPNAFEENIKHDIATTSPMPTKESTDLMDLTSEDETLVSPDFEQHQPYYAPTAPAFYSAAAVGGGLPATQTLPYSHLIDPLRIRSLLPSAIPPLAAADELLPCEVPECHYYVSMHEYEQHMLLHHYDLVKRHRDSASSSSTASAQFDRARTSTSQESSLSLVPCDYPGCGRLVDIDSYLSHQRSHENSATAQFTAQHGNEPYRPLPSQRYERGGTAASDRNYVTGIIPLLNQIFTQRKDLEVYLCNPIQFFFRSKGDGGFGCGYKNIQTLCSALLQFDLNRQVLFDGYCTEKKADPSNGAATAAAAASSTTSSSSLHNTISRSQQQLPRMPTIAMLQSYIDLAHQRGFDVVGAAQVGQLRNSKTWIGAVEAHALFCSYGLKSELIDFKSSHIGLMEYVWNYFSARTQPVGYVTGQQTFGHGPGDRQQKQASTLETHAHKYVAESLAGVVPRPPGSIPPPKNFCPPLYFQHQGHSRTIIGIVHNLRTDRFRLLVLDPDMTGGGTKLIHGLSSANPATTKQLYRTEDALRAKEYQMVMIASYGLMTPQEQQKSKRPFSTVISALESTPSPTPTATAAGLRANQPAQQDTGQHLTKSHERGAGGLATAKARTKKRWKIERREVDEAASVRKIITANQGVNGAGGSGGDQEEERKQANEEPPTKRPKFIQQRLVTHNTSTAAAATFTSASVASVHRTFPPSTSQRAGVPVIPPTRPPPRGHSLKSGGGSGRTTPGPSTSSTFTTDAVSIVPQSITRDDSDPSLRSRLPPTSSPSTTTATHPRSSSSRLLHPNARPNSSRSPEPLPPPAASSSHSPHPRAASCSRLPPNSRLLQMYPQQQQ